MARRVSEKSSLHRRLGPVLIEHGGEAVAGLAGIVDEAVVAGLLRRLAEGVEGGLVGEVEGVAADVEARMRGVQLVGQGGRRLSRERYVKSTA